MNHEVFVSKVNSWNIHVVMIHNICLYFAATLKWDVCLGEASPLQIVLFCSFCGPLKGSCWKCSELFLDLHRTFAFCGERCAQVGHTCIDLCAPAGLESTNPWEFSAFHPGAVSARNGGWRGMMRKGGVALLCSKHSSVEVQKTTYFLYLFFSVDLLI